MNNVNFENLLTSLDLKLFETITSQSTENDKKSFLACQLATHSLLSSYKYLEIGSYLGGSIQPHLLDDMCIKIFSIDKRPRVQPDERGVNFTYLNNSTQRMMELLKKVSVDGLNKIVTIDGDTKKLTTDIITEKVNFCFIDGEHTDEAVFSDFQFCFRCLSPTGLIMFHDASIIYNGLRKVICYLQENKINFYAYNLPDVVFVIEIGNYPLHENPVISNMLFNNHIGYLASLESNDMYRQFANKPLFKKYRNLIAKKRNENIFY